MDVLYRYQQLHKELENMLEGGREGRGGGGGGGREGGRGRREGGEGGLGEKDREGWGGKGV